MVGQRKHSSGAMADADGGNAAMQVDTPATPAVPLGPFSLPVLKIIIEGQGLHGLRYGDYQRYRQYCGRRLQRLRKGLNFVHWELGKGKSKFVQRAISEDTVVDQRYLELVLYKAERCWAYAMQLRDKKGGEPGREVHHMSRLLAKAVTHSAHLEALCRAKADDRSVLEAEAYAAWLAGALYVQQEKAWDTALQKLTRCRTVYDEMFHHAPSGAEKEMYQKRVEELDPLIRYCRYNVSKEGGGGDLEEESHVLMEIGRSNAGGDMLRGMLEKSLADTRLKQASGHEIEWLGQKISIENPSIHQHIIAAEGLQYELDQMETVEDKIAAYDKIFMALEDAKSAIRDDITKSLQKGDESGGVIATLQQVRNKVEHSNLNRKRERDLLLVQQLQDKLRLEAADKRAQQARKAAKPEDVVNMFETLLNTTEEMSAIPGIKEDAAMSKVCAARLLLFKALRVVYLAHSYVLIKQYAQAHALFSRAQQLEKVARQRMQESEARDAVDQLWLDKLDNLARLGMADTQAAHATAMASSSGPTSASSTVTDASTLKLLASTPLSTRLNNYDAAVYGDGKAPKLVDFPPPIEAVACKPVLFDLALNKAEYPDLAKRCEKKKAGIMGWFGRN